MRRKAPCAGTNLRSGRILRSSAKAASASRIVWLYPRRLCFEPNSGTATTAIRQDPQSKPFFDCPANHTPSTSSASPQQTHSAADCLRSPLKHSSHTGEEPAMSSGPPQALLSARKKIVTRSSTTSRTTLPGNPVLRSTRDTARHSSTPLRCPPGGAPRVNPSDLSFRHWLKTHLTRHHRTDSCVNA